MDPFVYPCDTVLAEPFLAGAHYREAVLESKWLLKGGPVYSWYDWPSLPTAALEHRRSMHKALHRVMSCVREHGPYDGLFGYGQGAVLATILSSPLCYRSLFGYESCPWRFVVCANAGGTRVLSAHGLVGDETTPALAATLGRRPLALPSLHLISAKDAQRADSLELRALYAPALATSFVHPFAKELPAKLRQDAALTEALATFFTRAAGKGPTAVHSADAAGSDGDDSRTMTAAEEVAGARPAAPALVASSSPQPPAPRSVSPRLVIPYPDDTCLAHPGGSPKGIEAEGAAPLQLPLKKKNRAAQSARVKGTLAALAS